MTKGKKNEARSVEKRRKNAFGRFISKLRWFTIEIIKVYSTERSYFSKKRLESGIGLFIAEWGMIFWLIRKIDVMNTYDFAIWASMQFLVAGYMVKQIQIQKQFEIINEEENNEESYPAPEPNYHEPHDYGNYDDIQTEDDCCDVPKPRKPRRR